MKYRVSITTHKKRLAFCVEPLKTILNQNFKADSTTLYLSEQLRNEIPQELNALTEFGLTIRFVSDIGPATKLIPALRDYPEDCLITLDDDILYPPDTVLNLVETFERHLDGIVCHNARVYEPGKEYRRLRKVWASKSKTKRTFKFIPLGNLGVLYPPGSLHPDVTKTGEMYAITPYNDDFWFWIMCLRKDTKIRLAEPCSIVKTDTGAPDALWSINRNHNDGRLNALISHYPEVLEKLVAPGLIEMAAHYVQAVVKHVATGGQTRDDSEVDRLLSICQTCEFFRNGYCKICGCRCNRSRNAFLNKLRMRSQRCPNNKF